MLGKPLRRKLNLTILLSSTRELSKWGVTAEQERVMEFTGKENP